jgi:hypothetical protein
MKAHTVVLRFQRIIRARQEGTMRTRWMLGMLTAAALAAPAAQAQETNESGIRTETQERLRSGPPQISWFDLLGALGLLGLLGLKKEHGDDSYHPSSVD